MEKQPKERCFSAIPHLSESFYTHLSVFISPVLILSFPTLAYLGLLSPARFLLTGAKCSEHAVFVSADECTEHVSQLALCGTGSAAGQKR